MSDDLEPNSGGPLYTHTLVPCEVCQLTEDEGWYPHDHPMYMVESDGPTG